MMIAYLFLAFIKITSITFDGLGHKPQTSNFYLNPFWTYFIFSLNQISIWFIYKSIESLARHAVSGQRWIPKKVRKLKNQIQ